MLELLPIVLLPPQQFCQTCETASALEEFMGQKFLGIGTAANVDAEADAEE